MYAYTYVCVLFFNSVSQQHSTNCLAILQNVSSGITRHRYCCTLYHSMSVTVQIEPSLLNVICFYRTNRLNSFFFFSLRIFSPTFRPKLLKDNLLLLVADKDAVEKRLYVLQQQGYIYATDRSYIALVKYGSRTQRPARTRTVFDISLV